MVSLRVVAGNTDVGSGGAAAGTASAGAGAGAGATPAVASTVPGAVKPGYVFVPAEVKRERSAPHGPVFVVPTDARRRLMIRVVQADNRPCILESCKEVAVHRLESSLPMNAARNRHSTGGVTSIAKRMMSRGRKNSLPEVSTAKVRRGGVL